MATQPQKDSVKKPEAKHDLGLSRSVYALGNSVKDGFIWGTVTTALTVGVLFLGGEKTRNQYEKARKTLKELSDKLLTKLNLKEAVYKLIDKIKENISGPMIGTGIAIGWLATHIAQIPSSIKGWKQVQRANDRYSKLVDEKEKLVMANADLAIENQLYKEELYKDALDKTDASFTSRMPQRPVTDLVQSRPVADLVQPRTAKPEAAAVNTR